MKENNAKVTQKILLITLCATELCYAITGITLFCFVLLDTWNVVALALALMIFNVTTVTFFYICIMAMIEIDRFLEIYLNIYYQDENYFNWSPYNLFSFLYPFIHCRRKKPTDCWKNANLLCCSNTRVGLLYYCFLYVSLHHEGSFKTSQKYKANTTATSKKLHSCSSQRTK